MRKIPFVVLLISILMAACEPIPSETETPDTPSTLPPANEPVELQEIDLDIGYGVDGGWYELYFTDPIHPDADSLRGGPDRQLAAAIDEARLRDRKSVV